MIWSVSKNLIDSPIISSGKNVIFAEPTEKEIVVQQYEMAVVHIATPNE